MEKVMSNKTLLFEIGVEELPYQDQSRLRDQLPDIVEETLSDLRLPYSSAQIHVAPRRVGILVYDLATQQESHEELIKGPPAVKAIDDAGEYTKAAIGFARSHGVDIEKMGEFLVVEETNRGPYLHLKRVNRGSSLEELFSRIAQQWIERPLFPLTMMWEDKLLSYSRPIRWLIALYGDQVLSFNWGGLQTDRYTYGHRRHTLNPVVIPDADSYVSILEENLVLVDRSRRLSAVREEIGRQCRDRSASIKENEVQELLEEVCDLVEWPMGILCRIPDRYLSLPDLIITTPMIHHQRFFPLREEDGKLSPFFVGVANGNFSEEAIENVRKGYERVINARLSDAHYFWEMDLKSSLIEHAAKLQFQSVHARLGSFQDKINRLQKLVTALVSTDSGLPVNEGRLNLVIGLMKADLATQMVSEFTSLEGAVGKLYAEEEGIDEDICLAIQEHRLPRASGDSLPHSPLGVWSALLDRIDTLVGFFGIGERPTGASDPYALRRAAITLIQILENHQIEANLEQWVNASEVTYGGMLAEDTYEAVLSFLRTRMRVIARERGADLYLVDAVLDVHYKNPYRALRIIESLRHIKGEVLDSIAEQHRRIRNILDMDLARLGQKNLLLKENVEKNLHRACEEMHRRISDSMETLAIEEAASFLAGILPQTRAFFEDTMVNVEDADIRASRHALLSQVDQLFLMVANFALLVKNR
jgi:tetrameric-type glycyl-tRNA synthetase beta subunit